MDSDLYSEQHTTLSYACLPSRGCSPLTHRASCYGHPYQKEESLEAGIIFCSVYEESQGLGTSPLTVSSFNHACSLTH